MYGFIFLGYFLFIYILQFGSNKLEDVCLRALGIRESDTYNSEFLLTKRSNVGDILGIADIIS